MMMRYDVSLLAFIVVCVSFPGPGTTKEPSSDAAKASDAVREFTLSDYRGKTWKLSEFAEQKVIVLAFVGTECPLVKLYANRLVELDEEYANKVAFVGINSNQQDSLTELAHFARTQGIEFPLLKDAGNKLADELGAQRTPEVLVLDAERAIRYRGRIDDQYTYGIQRPTVDHEYLIDAIDALLAGRKVDVTQTEVVGCHIGRVLQPNTDSPVTYSNQISRILQKNCVACHREGEIAPFALTDYDEVVGWAEMIEEVIREQRMPPWHANPKYGHFANDARLPDTDKELVYRWVDAGAPKGDPSQLPPAPKFTQGWQIDQPDLIVYMRDEPFSVPATGEVKYQYFAVDPGFTEDKWIRMAECRPGNRSVVHHIIVATMPSKERRIGRQLTHGGLESDWLTATAPGARPLILEDGYAKRIPAGSRLVFQLHYTPNGTPQQDRSCVGLVFADPRTVRKEVATGKAQNHRLRIPPGADDYRVEARHKFPKDTLMLAMFPHMHLRGKSFRYTAIYPDGQEKTLLDVPNYDFNWQNGYELAEPELFPAGSTLLCVAHFDNSEDNLANPDPTQTVRWGDQTWEEMMIGYYDAVLADQDLTAATRRPRTESFLETIAKHSQVPDALRRHAAKALTSTREMADFGERLRERVPQLDRVCFTVVDGSNFNVVRCVQDPHYDETIKGEGVKIATVGLAMPKYATRTEPTVHQQINTLRGLDFRYMSTAFASSMHVPVKIDGQSGTINFWSSEPDAFPQEAVSLLGELAQIMVAQ